MSDICPRCFGWPGRVRGPDQRKPPPAGGTHDGPDVLLLRVPVLVSHSVHQRSAHRERRQRGGLLLLRRHQGHPAARPRCAGLQHGGSHQLQRWCRGRHHPQQVCLLLERHTTKVVYHGVLGPICRWEKKWRSKSPRKKKIKISEFNFRNFQEKNPEGWL